MIWLAIFVLSLVASVFWIAISHTSAEVKAMNAGEVRKKLIAVTLLIYGGIWSVATIILELQQ